MLFPIEYHLLQQAAERQHQACIIRFLLESVWSASMPMEIADLTCGGPIVDIEFGAILQCTWRWIGYRSIDVDVRIATKDVGYVRTCNADTIGTLPWLHQFIAVAQIQRRTNSRSWYLHSLCACNSTGMQSALLERERENV
jgi:hypothetical protein